MNRQRTSNVVGAVADDKPSKRYHSKENGNVVAEETEEKLSHDAGEKEATVPRNIGLIGGVSFIVGSIIGSGIFIAPREIAEGSGSVGLSLVCWVLCGFISVLGAFCYAELGTVIKESGAEYAYLQEAFGPLASFSFSWINCVLLRPAGMATLTLTCAQYIIYAFFNDGCGGAPDYILKILAIVFLILLGAINIYSIKLASRIQVVLTVAKLIALTIIILGGVVKLCQGSIQYLSTGFENSESRPGVIAKGLYSGMWAYDGWNTANYMTEEIINPERNLPLSIVIGLPLVIFVYVLTNISYYTVMSLGELVTSSAPVAVTWAERVIPSVAWIIPIFVAMSAFGTGNGTLFSGGRLIFVAARNDHLPEVLAMVHVDKFTPIPAIIFTVLVSIAFILPGDVSSLIDFIGFTMWIFYGMNMLAVIVFRYHKKFRGAHRPVKIPLIIPVLGFLASVFLVLVPLITNPQMEFLYALGIILIGLIIYAPFVHLKVRFPCTKHVTKFFQLYLHVFRPTKLLD